MLKIDVIPLREGGWDGWAYINDPKVQEVKEHPRRMPMHDDESDIPF